MNVRYHTPHGRQVTPAEALDEAVAGVLSVVENAASRFSGDDWVEFLTRVADGVSKLRVELGTKCAVPGTEVEQ